MDFKATAWSMIVPEWEIAMKLLLTSWDKRAFLYQISIWCLVWHVFWEKNTCKINYERCVVCKKKIFYWLYKIQKIWLCCYVISNNLTVMSELYTYTVFSFYINSKCGMQFMREQEKIIDISGSSEGVSNCAPIRAVRLVHCRLLGRDSFLKVLRCGRYSVKDMKFSAFS